MREGRATVWRVLAATLCASVAYIPVVLILVTLLPGQDNEWVGVFIVLGYQVSLACVVAIGIPAHLLLQKHGMTTFPYYAAIRFALPFGFVAVVQPFGKDGVQMVLLQALQFGLYGLVSALVFWWVAARRPLIR